MTRTKSTLLALIAVLLSPMAANADIITFAGAYGSPVSTTSEGIFDYFTVSGGLFRDSGGNGDAYDMEGCSACGGGVLGVVRNDVLGGLFTFDGLDVKFEFNTSYLIIVEGYLGGILQASEGFFTTADSTWFTFSSFGLAGMAFDELRVILDATSSTATNLDNLVLTAVSVPEPGTLALLGIGLLGMGMARRRKKV